MTMQNQNATMLDAICGSSVRVSILDRLSSVDLCTFDSPEYAVFPGFCDVHVHFREPGFSYKETIASGSYASARGGYTAVCTMPNLNPVPDSKENLDVQLELIKNGAVMNVKPYGSITVGQNGEELSDMAAMAPYVCAFSDDGKGVQSDGSHHVFGNHNKAVLLGLGDILLILSHKIFLQILVIRPRITYFVYYTTTG